MVEIEITKTPMNPANYNAEKVMRITKHDDVEDCLKVTEREAKNGKGKFKQMCMSLADDSGEYEMRYLLSSDLTGLAKAFGTASANWIGKSIKVSASKNGNGHYRWNLAPAE